MYRCGEEYVWGEFGGDVGEDRVVHLAAEDQNAADASKLKVSADNTTKATYSVMFYYTATFARSLMYLEF